jgi:hypothetical protein
MVHCILSVVTSSLWQNAKFVFSEYIHLQKYGQDGNEYLTVKPGSAFF